MQKKTIRMLALLCVLTCVVSIFSLINVGIIDIGSTNNDFTQNNVYEPHLRKAGYWDLTGSPIFIDDSNPSRNWDWFESQVWYGGGDGSAGNPYIIENIRIDGQNLDSCIAIKDSTAYFIIRNCTLINAGTTGETAAGICFINVDNGKIMNNTVLSSDIDGIYLYDSHGINVTRNKVANNGIFYGGITMYRCSFNDITENKVTNNHFGFNVHYSDYNNITENAVEYNGWGINIEDYCTFNNISGNEINNNDYEGIVLEDFCDFNLISENIIGFNSRIGIWIYRGVNNTISENNVNDNSDNGIMLVRCLENYILENVATYNGKSGIFLLESRNTTVWGNTVDYSAETGMTIERQSNVNFVTENIISYNPIGIFLNQSEINYVVLNIFTGNGIDIEELDCGINIFEVDDDTEAPVITAEYFGGYNDGDPGYIEVIATDNVGLSTDPSGYYYPDPAIINVLQAWIFLATDNDFDYPLDKLSTYLHFSVTLTDDDVEAPVINVEYFGNYNDSDAGYIEVIASDNIGLSEDPSGIYHLDNTILGTPQEWTFTAVDNDYDRPGDALTTTESISITLADDDHIAPEINIDYFGGGTDSDPGYIVVTATDNIGLGVNPSGTYYLDHLIIDTPQEWTFIAVDNDDDRPGDSLTTTVPYSITLVDDDTTLPQIDLAYDGDFTDANPGTLYITASDSSGLFLDPTQNIIVPTEPGTYTWVLTAIDDDNDRPGDRLTYVWPISGTIIDDDSEAPIINVEYFGGGTDADPGYIVVTASDNVGLSVNPSGTYFLPATPGTHTWTFTATDNDNDRPDDSLTTVLTYSKLLTDKDVIFIDDSDPSHDWNWFKSQPFYGGGDGTAGNEFIIENLDIDGTNSSSCIEIRHSDAFFTIRNCNLYHAGTSGEVEAAICLIDVRNGQITGNVISNNYVNGIALYESSDIMIYNNEIKYDLAFRGASGINLFWSNGNHIIENIVRNNHFGINVLYSSGNYITDNDVYFNGWGINLEDYSNDNTISGNFVYENDNQGIVLENNCDYNVISGNSVNFNHWIGIWVINVNIT
jgi:parallel beta-helix repeat protein